MESSNWADSFTTKNRSINTYFNAQVFLFESPACQFNRTEHFFLCFQVLSEWLWRIEWLTRNTEFFWGLFDFYFIEEIAGFEDVWQLERSNSFMQKKIDNIINSRKKEKIMWGSLNILWYLRDTSHAIKMFLILFIIIFIM